jgi:hypothetical protein
VDAQEMRGIILVSEFTKQQNADLGGKSVQQAVDHQLISAQLHFAILIQEG